jgi:hypothetical protein
VVEVALSGNLGFVPLEEVLRLLTRSDQRGSVDVRGEDVRGRVFIGKKGVSLATTAEDRDLHKHLVNSGYVDDAFLRKVAAGESTFADLGDHESSIIELLREMTIESLYHLTTKGATFEVAEDATSLYASPRPFELESILDDARRRAEEWSDVHAAIGDLETTIRMNRDTGDREEIRISREAWRLLCELGSGASVNTMAERLGTTEFWIARVAADMAEQKLLVLSEDTPEPVTAPAPQYVQVVEERPDESWWVEPEPGDEAEASEGSVETESEGSVETEEAPASTEQIPASTESSSRFGHFGRSTGAPQDYAQPAQAYEAPGAETEQKTEGPEPAPGYGPATDEVAVGQAEGVEEDTEAFLEKVFSQLEVNGQADVEEEGHGLLRRRRMGSVLKDIDED